MRHRTLTLIIVLELYALFLTVLRALQGIRTDEAKYLLDIAYPHPPVLRTFMGLTAHLPGHEFVWRFIFASVLVQMVWFFVDIGGVLTPARRRALLLAWLFSTAVLLQAGSVMMMIPVACFCVVLLWYILRQESITANQTGLIGIGWTIALFTSYQSVLLFPLVVSAMLRSRQPITRTIILVVVPILLLILYTFTNPLILASMLDIAGQGSSAASPVADRAISTALVLLLGGSAVLVLTGLIGIVTSRRLDLVLTFALLLGYTAISSQQYYAILFTPLLVAGTYLLLCRRKLRPSFLALAHVVTAFFAAWMFWYGGDRPLEARATIRALTEIRSEGAILIDGPFGHEWQYEAGDQEIIRFTETLSLQAEERADAFVCTAHDCSEHVDTDIWVRLQSTPIPTWVRRTPL
ncbi:MAG: hypothetical protein ABL890_03300 [Candidatus Peribacteraceae bacterium]